jgi:plasmid stabilization system protein ParE
MNYKFVNRPAVRFDIINALEYYNKINPELSKQFLFRIREAKGYIANSPMGFQLKYNEVRTIMTKQFPYHIHYIIDDTKQLIIILAVIHAFKNPMDYSHR